MGKYMGWVLVTYLLLGIANIAAAEVLAGYVKAIAPESRSLTVRFGAQTRFIIWEGGTVWKNLAGPAELKVDEPVQIETRQGDDSYLAVTVKRPVLTATSGVKVLTAGDLAAQLAGVGSGLIPVDVRPAEAFSAGHINGAISAPLDRLERKAFSMLPTDRSVSLVLYDDGGESKAALKAAALLHSAGYRDIGILADGIAGWTAAGQFPAVASDCFRKKRPIIIDLREPDQVALGHIAEAVNFPLANLQQEYGRFPLERRLAIVVYGATDADSLAAAAAIRKWGYRNVAYFPGGTATWLAGAEVLKTGPAGKQIIGTSDSHGAASRPDDFELALGSPNMVDVVDARTASNQKTGGFPRSAKIPLMELPRRYVELNKEKVMAVFAEDPERAEMAFDFLRGKGFKATYLHGSVEFGKDGSYTIK